MAGGSVRVNILLILVTVAFQVVSTDNVHISFQATEEVSGTRVIGNIIAAANLTGTVYQEFQISQNEYKEYFEIQPDGNLSRVKKMDRDTLCPNKETCKLVLQVFANPELDFDLFVTVDLEDVNDNYPLFQPNVVNLPIQENSPADSSYELASCSDKDAGNNSQLRFELVPNGTTFKLEKHENLDGRSYTLTLVVPNSLDRENLDRYQLLVNAFDGGNPPKKGELTIDITVTDMNDNRPMFFPDKYNVTIDEDIADGTSILNVTATDRDTGDNAKLSYQITGSDPPSGAGLFGINGSTGEIYLDGDFGGSTGPFTLYLKASDHGNPKKTSTQALVIVNIRDKNDNEPTITVGPFNDGHVMENADLNTQVAFVTVDDEDRGENGVADCTCKSDYFSIEPKTTVNTFRIQVAAAINREALTDNCVCPKEPTVMCQCLTVLINCTDRGVPPLSSSKSYEFFIDDENDNSPEFESKTYVANITEDNVADAVVLRVSATDKDKGKNANIQYEFVPFEGMSKFTIDSGGLIRATGSLDRETQAMYSFKVNASDQGSPKLFDVADVRVNVLDANDHAPAFMGDSYAMSVSENVNISSSIGQVTAQDKDLGLNAIITYSIPSNYSSYPFRVLDDGTVILTRMLDREEKAQYQFEIVASDHGSPPQESKVPVYVTVLDVNDNAPFLKFPQGENDTVLVSDKSMPDSIIASIIATDADDKENKELVYTILAGNTEGKFRIDENKGDIILVKPVSARDIKIYKLTISVKDKGLTQLETRATLHIEFFIANETDVSETVSVKKGQNILIAIIISCVTFVLSVIIIIIICVLRKKDRQSKLFDAKAYDQQKIMSSHRNSNRSSSSKGSNDKMFYPENTYTDNGYANKKGKKEVSFSLEDDHDGGLSTENNKPYDPVSTFKSPSPIPSQNSSFHSDSLPPPKPERADDSRQRDIHRMTSLRVHQALIQNQNNNNKWSQPTQEETGKNYITLMKNPLDDTHSETSGETTTSDSGRGGSEEDIRSSMTNPHDTDEPRSPTSTSSHPFYTMESQQPTFSSFRGNSVHKPGPILASYLDHRPPSRTSGDVFKNAYPMNDLSNPNRNIPSNKSMISGDLPANPNHRNIHNGPGGHMPTTSFSHNNADLDPKGSNPNHLNLNSFVNSFENESLANRSQDDDNTTTTSGSYTINDLQDDLLMSGESKEMFYKPDTFV